jgi:hypothetical protein
MQKSIEPYTIEWACVQARDILGADRLAIEFYCSASLIYKWGDPLCSNRPSLAQALRMNAMCAAEGGMQPFTLVMEKDADKAQFTDAGMCVVNAALGLQAAVGCVAHVVQAANSPTGPGGRRITTTERRLIADELTVTRKRLCEIERALVGTSNVHPIARAAE